MKNLLLYLIIFSLFLSSCVKSNVGKNELPDNETKTEVILRMQTSKEYTVPVKEGYVTQVVFSGEVVATAVEPMTILLPITSAVTKVVDDLTLVYVPKAQYPNTIENESSLFQVICFEDSKETDYDYNDLVIHVYYKTKGNIFGFGVQPVALGSSKSFKLGCAVYKGETQVFKGLITQGDNDCRKQYFEGKEGMFNTITPNFFPKNSQIPGWHEYLGSSIRNWDMSKIEGSGANRVEWYILVGNDEHFALSTQYLNSSLNTDMLPYGLVFTNVGAVYYEGSKEVGHDWFNYPKETCHINDVYPQLWEWMTKGTNYNFSEIYDQNNIPAKAFDAAGYNLFQSKSIDVCDKKYLQN